MKPCLTLFFPALVAALVMSPSAARADANPDFDDDAAPILRLQPGLLQYVESRFEVKDRGTAKFPGDDDHRPGPPFIFRARPLGSSGPFNLRLLIQPGHPGHILGVVDITKAHLSPPAGPSGPPAVASQPPTPPQPAPQEPPAPAEPPPPVAQEPASSAPAPAQQPTEPTADTPSGPILDSGNSSSSSPQPSLAPPPDPAPSTH